MKVIELTAPNINAFLKTTYSTPSPAMGEVLIRLHAASPNFLDNAVATVAYPGPKFPLIPVADGAGEIAELGAGVENWKVGDHVILHFMPDWQDGTMTLASFATKRGVSAPNVERTKENAFLYAFTNSITRTMPGVVFFRDALA